MAAYFASQALVEVGEYVAPLSSHPATLYGVGDFPSLVVPLIPDFFQELEQLSFSWKRFIRLCVSMLGRESKDVPEVPQRQREFVQFCCVSL